MTDKSRIRELETYDFDPLVGYAMELFGEELFNGNIGMAKKYVELKFNEAQHKVFMQNKRLTDKKIYEKVWEAINLEYMIRKKLIRPKKVVKLFYSGNHFLTEMEKNTPVI